MEDSQFNVVDELYNEAEYHEKRAERLRRAAELIEEDEGGEGEEFEEEGNGRGGNRNFSDRERNISGRSRSRRGGYSADDVEVGTGPRGGNRVRSRSDNPDDLRTRAGREQHDADEFSERDLREFMRNADPDYTNQDGTFDRRTKIGRALFAAGMIDEEGFPVEGRGGNRGRNTGRGRSRSTSNR